MTAALRFLDVHDDEAHDNPANPCPGCDQGALEDGICAVCEAEFCERCGKVEVTGRSACCPSCAPTYTIAVGHVYVAATRSLRRAWEGQRYLEESHGSWYGATILNRDRQDVDTDGITDREQALLDGWDVWHGTDIGRRVASVHLCLQWADDEGLP